MFCIFFMYTTQAQHQNKQQTEQLNLKTTELII